MSGLIWVQTVCKVYQETTKFTAGRLRIKEIQPQQTSNKKGYDSELPYQRPDLIEVMEIEIDLTTSTNVHNSFFYKCVRECLD